MALSRVCVVGAGSWGTTIASLVAPRVHTTLWARRLEVAEEIAHRHTNSTYLGDRALPTELAATGDLAVALRDADLVVVAVPSHVLRSVLELVAPPRSARAVLSLTKGLERDTLLRATEIVSQCWPGLPTGVLTGPNLAEEVLDGQPTASVVALRDEALALELQALFASERLRVYTNHDVTGCEIAGAVKNVMAIACGMAVGLGFGDNTRAALVTRALAELARLGVALGGEAVTFTGLAGLGDLVATCTSSKSRNFSLGVALGRGASLAELLVATPTVAEGAQSCGPIVALARSVGVETPVADEVLAVLEGRRSPSDSIPALMGRTPRPEFDGSASGTGRAS
jgi:glycerol-3-phosphate dehydrogenase (NAD(P)+)